MATQSVRIGWRPYVNLTSAQAASNLLDSYSGAAAAYSLRKIKSSYTGSAIRVRRSSDNTELNIGFDSDGNLDTYVLSAFVGTGDGFVTTWYDQSGNSRNFTQTTALSQPQIVSTGSLILENGKVSVNFDGTNHRMYSSTLTNWTNQGFSTYVVSKFGGLNSNGRAVFAISNGVDLTNGYLHLIYRSDITNNFRVTHTTDGYATNSQNQNPLSTLPTTQILISTTRPASGNINFKLNNTTQSTITANTLGTLSGNFILGNYYTQNIISNGVYAHQGTISEVIVYPNSQESNTNGINTNINTYYSIYPNPSSVWNLLTAAYNADTKSLPSLKTSLFAAYNGESNANDSKGTNNGTAQGGLTYTTGKIGNAFSFNGTNALVSLPNTSGQFNFDGDFTVSVWFRSSNLSASRYFMTNLQNNGTTWGYGWTFFYSGSLGWVFQLANGANTNYVNFQSGYAANTWYHVVAVRKMGQKHKIYVNAVDTPATQSGNVNTTAGYIANQKMDLGGISSLNLYALCDLDGVNMWNKALTQAEVSELYNSGNGTQYITDSFYKPTTNNALLVNNGTAVGGLAYGTGKIGNAFVFNGSNSYVRFPDNSFNSLNGSFSVSAWFKTPSSIQAVSNYILNNRSGNTWFNNPNGFAVQNYGNSIYFVIYNNTNSYTSLNVSYTFSTNTWYHITATKLVNGNMKLYLNGALIGTLVTTVNPTYLATVSKPCIGADLFGTKYDDYFAQNGFMVDTLNIWAKELSAAEVTELYNSGNGKQYPN